jgi:hypothetical protein
MTPTLATAVLCAASLFMSSVQASPLDAAYQFLRERNYPAAKQAFGQLAQAGNSEAQLRPGEMFWYGEGGTSDRVRGDALFAQAAAAGNPAARAAMGWSARRVARAADIAQSIHGYDGAELRAGPRSCPLPAFPEKALSNKEMRATTAAANAWLDCYQGVIEEVAASMPPGRRIPEDLVEVMSDEEVAAACVHLDQVHTRVLSGARAEANSMEARRLAWRAATLAYKDELDRLLDMRTLALRAELDRFARQKEANPARPPGKY